MMVKIYAAFMAAIVTTFIIVSSSLAAPFIEGLEDVPLPKGMQQMQTDSLSFGNEESRLVEIYLTGSKVGFKSIAAFYMDTLPQLGWIFQGKTAEAISFYRDGEKLDIAKEKSTPLVVRITVKSQN